MIVKYLAAASAVIVVAVTASVGGVAGVTRSGVSRAPSYAGVRQNVRRQNTGPSFVEIDGVEAEGQIASDGVGGEWFGNALDPSGFGLVRIDETTHVAHVSAHPYDDLSALAPGADGNTVWFGSADDDVVGRINLQTRGIKLRRVSGSVASVIAGPSNAIWFSLPGSNEIGQLDPSTFAVKYYSTKTFGIDGIVVGSDGGLWFYDAPNESIGRFDSVTHDIWETSLPYAEHGVNGLTNGPDNAIWFSLGGFSADQIGRLDITTHNFTMFKYAKTKKFGLPVSIVTRDSEVWFVTYEGAVGEITPGKRHIQMYQIPQHPELRSIARGADDQLWATELSAQRIWEICPDLSQAQCAAQSRR